MQRWTFEPGHTAAEFCVRHMMVTNVRGHFKNVHGTLEFDPELPALSRIEAVIDARGRWSGERDRDIHLKGPDFFAEVIVGDDLASCTPKAYSYI